MLTRRPDHPSPLINLLNNGGYVYFDRTDIRQPHIHGINAFARIGRKASGAILGGEPSVIAEECGRNFCGKIEHEHRMRPTTYFKRKGEEEVTHAWISPKEQSQLQLDSGLKPEEMAGGFIFR